MKFIKTKKTSQYLAHYPKFFLLQIGFRTFSWVLFLSLFFFLGKKFAKTDLLGKIYHFIFRQEKSFEQYFLGTAREEKNKLINLAICFILAIIILNFLALLLNRYLWNKDRYIENNEFYLYNKWVFLLNSLTHLASAFLLILSLASAATVVLTLLFISFNSWDFRTFRKSPTPRLEDFFTRKNSYILKMLLYSMVVIFVVPLVIGYFQRFHKTAMEGTGEGFSKVYQEMINSSDFTKSFAELIIKANYSLFHWVILIWFAKGLIGERRNDFSSFWTKVNGIEKRTTDFKRYYYYQESWAQTNQTPIKLGDYNYLENSPSFVSQEYLGEDLGINQFAQRNRQVVKYIEFCGQKVKEPSKRNFLYYCLFNEFKSWADCLRTQVLIKEVE
ncbi:MAG: hypothetical protein MRERC_3c143 [Mycoplasmataceae bacterium RC_NB112A]|nr:MAG: hypothetical protein MRERC_3c143 [Mycoplasmataceae bacterium RC_NB112A]